MKLNPEIHYSKEQLDYRIRMIFAIDPTKYSDGWGDTPQEYQELMFEHIPDLEDLKILEVYTSKISIWAIYEQEAVEEEDYEFAARIKRVREEIQRVYLFFLKQLYKKDYSNLLDKMNVIVMENENR